MLELFYSDAAKVLCLILGAAMMAVEIIIPGFGIAGLCSLVLMGIGTACMWIQHGMLAGLITLLIVLILAITECVLVIRSFSKGRLSRSALILNSEISREDENTVETGSTGKTLTVLNPVGFAEINGKRTEVLSETGYIEKDTEIKVVSVEGRKITVTK